MGHIILNFILLALTLLAFPFSLLATQRRKAMKTLSFVLVSSVAVFFEETIHCFFEENSYARNKNSNETKQ